MHEGEHSEARRKKRTGTETSILQVRTYAMGDTIIKRGSIGTTMYFVDLGTARAEIRGHTATELKSGDYFGEIAFAATCGKFLRESREEVSVRLFEIFIPTEGACLRNGVTATTWGG